VFERSRLIAMSATLSAALMFSSPAPGVEQPSVSRVEVSGTAFRVTLSDGSLKQGAELAGAVFVFNINGMPVRVRIASIMPDPKDETILLHDFRIDGTDMPFCNPDHDGKQLGFPLVGQSTPDGRFLDARPDVFELVCTSGAQGKCVRFGYRPWEKAPNGGPMRDYYNACVRMVRADYCGDGRAWTRDGTLIDIWDTQGIQKPDIQNESASFSFEAGWTPEGAVCVAHTRIPENLTLDHLKTSCPRLAAMRLCDEASAKSQGALLYNRSQ
jgi:hypothetical protein